MTSREISEAFIPSVPMVTPSLMATVLISIGVPPARRTPSLTLPARRRRPKLQGIVSIQLWATPTMGRRRSSSPKPMALSIARAGARSRPSNERPAHPAQIFSLHRPTLYFSAIPRDSRPGPLRPSRQVSPDSPSGSAAALRSGFEQRRHGGAVGGRQAPGGRPQMIVHLGGRLRATEADRDRGVRQHPGDGQLDQGVPAGLRPGLQAPGRRQVSAGRRPR